MTPRVLIIGGGIAGATAALALHKTGVDVSVHEAHPRAGTDLGAFLTLASNGMLALGQIDAASAVAGVGFGLTSIRVSDADGSEIATRPMGRHEDPLTRFRCLRWSLLCAELQAAVVQRGIPIRHGQRLGAVDTDPDGVTATFLDGSTARGELLIGADGLNSTVRNLLDPQVKPRYAGQNIYYGYTSASQPAGAPGRIDMVRGSSVAFGFAVSPAGEIHWFARVTGPELTGEQMSRAAPERLRKRLIPLLDKDSSPAAGIVAATGAELMVTNAYDLPALRRWRSDRVLLIGDAAHAAAPATGQGASMAMEDAVILAKALRDRTDLAAALRVYEGLRRPRVERNIDNSARMSNGDRPQQQPVSEEDIAIQLDWAKKL